jgi:hypothetical protein
MSKIPKAQIDANGPLRGSTVPQISGKIATYRRPASPAGSSDRSISPRNGNPDKQHTFTMQYGSARSLSLYCLHPGTSETNAASTARGRTGVHDVSRFMCRAGSPESPRRAVHTGQAMACTRVIQQTRTLGSSGCMPPANSEAQKGRLVTSPSCRFPVGDPPGRNDSLGIQVSGALATVSARQASECAASHHVRNQSPCSAMAFSPKLHGVSRANSFMPAVQV